jgi:glycosyltransferase involved in cell wall biosynthesis
MKVLFDHPSPFFLAHGGFETQILQTKAGLESLGVEVECARWWDRGQKADLIHYFSAARPEYLRLAQAQKLPVVMTQLFTETCNRPGWKLILQGAAVQSILAVPFFRATKDQLNWSAYQAASHLVVGLEAEKEVLFKVFRAPPSRVSVVPLGLSKTYLGASPGNRDGDYLITTGTVTPRKGSVPLAMLAHAAEVPVLFVGKPYHPSDPYWTQFEKLIDNKWVRYHAHLESELEMISLLRGARGFVLNSQFENWSLSASEAVACGLPLLLPNQKWSRERFGSEARYFERPGRGRNAGILRQFYDNCPRLEAPKIKLFSWAEVAERLKEIYSNVLSTSR